MSKKIVIKTRTGTEYTCDDFYVPPTGSWVKVEAPVWSGRGWQDEQRCDGLVLPLSNVDYIRVWESDDDEG